MYDTIIIGGGPAGYLAAERLGHRGKKVLLTEENRLGGTCLNIGCIPTKTLLNSAKLYVHAKEAEKFGVKAENLSYDWGAIQGWKNEVVSKLCAGVEGQMKRYGVEVIKGRGEITSRPAGGRPATVRSVSQEGKTAEHEGASVLVCTGSSPVMLPIPGAAESPLIVNSTGLLDLPYVPASLAVIGGGVIGLEFAGLFSAFGAQVTVIEAQDEIVPFMDREHAPILRRAMKDVRFALGCRVEKIEGGAVFYSGKDGKAETLEAEVILMAAGRRPVLEGWGAEAAGIGTDRQGVAVDERMRTNIPGIWAAGDVTGRSLLAHSAYRMAEVAVADILGEGNARMRYDAVPWALYGLTEAAGAGLTEQQAAAAGIEIAKASLPMKVSGRFAAENGFAGLGAVKVVAGAKDGRILGVHAVGAYASEFIWGAAALIEQEMRVKDVKELIFPHPTVSELIREAVWAIEPIEPTNKGGENA
ncbi:MAG: dihydrolipoyl dehydrogenase [Spirochaetes bacterium]|nr:dihydrolipoyl dehydrogenase [Spirochaetota bacterium]